MSPFALIDLIGRTVTLKMMQSLQDYAPDRFYVGESLSRAVDSDAQSPIADELTEWNQPAVVVETGLLHDTIVDALAREIRIMLDEQVVNSVSDIDVCLINGAGWPNAIGGVTPYLDGSGSSVRATGQLFHPEAHFA
jgi:hypothetical protein